MSDAWALVIAAAIPVVASGVGVLIKVVLDMKNQQSKHLNDLNDFREENRVDHGLVMNALLDLSEDVKEIKRDQQEHFKWHATKDKQSSRSRNR